MVQIFYVCLFVQSLSCVWLFTTPWTTAHQASLSLTISQSFLKLMSIELGIPSNHLILCCPLLLLPSMFPSIRVFPNESALCIRWPKYWSFSFSSFSLHTLTNPLETPFLSPKYLQNEGIKRKLLFFSTFFFSLYLSWSKDKTYSLVNFLKPNISKWTLSFYYYYNEGAKFVSCTNVSFTTRCRSGGCKCSVCAMSCFRMNEWIFMVAPVSAVMSVVIGMFHSTGSRKSWVSKNFSLGWSKLFFLLWVKLLQPPSPSSIFLQSILTSPLNLKVSIDEKSDTGKKDSWVSSASNYDRIKLH